MSQATSVLSVNHDLPIRTVKPVHCGKVRALYTLTKDDSARLIRERHYAINPDATLAIMVISDRISAFDCLWQAEGDLKGVPGKGMALNTIAAHWFSLFEQHGLAGNHIVEIPHPYVWIVQLASPIKVEAIARQYITGSMWRAYQKGARQFCGINLPEGLTENQRLPGLLITPSTKGILKGLDGVPELDDVNVSQADIRRHFAAFGLHSANDIEQYETLLRDGFRVIESALVQCDELFVDTKFEMGYITDAQGQPQMIYMDEVGTPDSSRIWETAPFQKDGMVIENSKEGFRQFLLNHVDDADVLLNPSRMPERSALAKNAVLPREAFDELSRVYLSMAQKITGRDIQVPKNPRDEIITILRDQFGLID